MDRLPFDQLQDLQIKHSLLTVEEEKRDIIPVEIPDDGELPGMEKKLVLVTPFSFSLGKTLSDFLASKGYNIDPGCIKKTREHKNASSYIDQMEQIMGKKIPQELGVEILSRAVNPNGLHSYWNALRIIAYHSFKSRKIIQKGEEIIPIKTKRQFEFHFHSHIDPELVGDQGEDFEESGESGRYGVNRDTASATLCFDGSVNTSFEEFYEYVLRRILGKLDRQIKRKEIPPLLVWRERFRDELTIFFKAKVGGNGYATDFQDSTVRALQRKGKKLKGLDAAKLVRQAFVEAIDSDEFSHREYTCMIARNRGYSHLAISRFTGFKTSEVKSILENAVPRISKIIYGVFSRKMETPETDQGLAVTEKLVKEILLSETKKV